MIRECLPMQNSNTVTSALSHTQWHGWEKISVLLSIICEDSWGKQEENYLRDLFEKNNAGADQMDFSHFQECVTRLVAVPPCSMAHYFDLLDRDCDGAISIVEFIAGMMFFSPFFKCSLTLDKAKAAYKKLRRQWVFMHFDIDGDGLLNLTEFQEFKQSVHLSELYSKQQERENLARQGGDFPGCMTFVKNMLYEEQSLQISTGFEMQRIDETLSQCSSALPYGAFYELLESGLLNEPEDILRFPSCASSRGESFAAMSKRLLVMSLPWMSYMSRKIGDSLMALTDAVGPPIASMISQAAAIEVSTWPPPAEPAIMDAEEKQPEDLATCETKVPTDGTAEFPVDAMDLQSSSKTVSEVCSAEQSVAIEEIQFEPHKSASPRRADRSSEHDMLVATLRINSPLPNVFLRERLSKLLAERSVVPLDLPSLFSLMTQTFKCIVKHQLVVSCSPTSEHDASPIVVLNEVNGDLNIVQRILSKFSDEMDNESFPDCPNIVFTGNIFPTLDYGTYPSLVVSTHCIAVLETVFILKVLFPQRVHFLRGSAETSQNKSCLHCCSTLYGEEGGMLLWNRLLDLFEFAPVAVKINSIGLIATGILTSVYFGKYIDDINSLKKPLQFDKVDQTRLIDWEGADALGGISRGTNVDSHSSLLLSHLAGLFKKQASQSGSKDLDQSLATFLSMKREKRTYLMIQQNKMFMDQGDTVCIPCRVGYFYPRKLKSLFLEEDDFSEILLPRPMSSLVSSSSSIYNSEDDGYTSEEMYWNVQICPRLTEGMKSLMMPSSLCESSSDSQIDEFVAGMAAIRAGLHVHR